MQPTPEYRQHHPVDPPHIGYTEFRPAWRRRSQLDTLLVRADIDPDQWNAGNRLVGLWQKAFGSLTPSSLRLASQRLGRNPQPGAPTPDIQTVAKLKSLKRKLGNYSFDLLTDAFVLELTWREIARAYLIEWRSAKRHAIKALDSLARLKGP